MMSASMLTYDAVDALTHDQHLSLLRFLCDTSLDSDKMREVLQRELKGKGLVSSVDVDSGGIMLLGLDWVDTLFFLSWLQ
jgi:hypothetical protein